MFKRCFCVMLGLLVALPSLAADQLMTMKLDVADGETITKERTIKVLVQSEKIVSEVEFYVNDDLRDTQRSTPYTFYIDPLAEKEGDEKLTFTAYNQSGDKISKSVTVHIESGAARGPEPNTEIAQDDLTQSKWDDAIYAARVALKADPKYEPAQIVLARAFMHKGEYDKAQEFAEDAQKQKPDDPEVLQVLAAIGIERAFNTYATGGKKEEMLGRLSAGLKDAITAQRKVLDSEFDKLSTPTSDTAVHYGDVAIRTKHFGAAISGLLPFFEKSGYKSEIGDRIAYAQLRTARFVDMLKTLQLLQANNTIDGYGYALWAVLDAYGGDEAATEGHIKQAIESAPSDLGVQTAQVYIALRTNNAMTFRNLAGTLANDIGSVPEVNYYLAILYNRMSLDSESDKAFQAVVFTDPLVDQVYIERGLESIDKALSGKLAPENAAFEIKTAGAMFEAAREARPDSSAALTALTIYDLSQEDVKDAADMADAAVKAAPEYAAAHYAAAVAFTRMADNLATEADNVKLGALNGIDPATQRKIDRLKSESNVAQARSDSEFATAQQEDPKRLAGTLRPSLSMALDYFENHKQMPLITPP